MDPGDIFRRLFGFPRGRPFEFEGNDVTGDIFSSEKQNRDDDGFHWFFGDSSRGLEGMFEHFHGDMWRQMESLHRQMEDMMAGFGAIDFPSSFGQPPLKPVAPESKGKDTNDGKVFIWSNTVSPFFGHANKKTPRDFMLKDGTDVQDYAAAEAPQDNKSKADSVFPFPRWDRSHPQSKEDTDLDGKISEDKILEMIKRPNQESEPQSELRKPGFFTNSKSVSVATFSGPNNKFEHKKTVRDSTGREETTIRRSLGDKTYTVTTVTGKDGIQERHEDFKNMDEKDLPKFEDDWKKPQQPQPTQHADSMLSTWPLPDIDMRDKDLFSKLFDWRPR